MIGEKLKELRIKNSIKQEVIGDLCGVTKATVSSWEKNRTAPSIELIKKICNYFNVSTDYLLNHTNSNDSKLETEDLEKIEKLKTAFNLANIDIKDYSMDDLLKTLEILKLMKK